VEIPFNFLINLDSRHVASGGSTTDLRGLVERERERERKVLELLVTLCVHNNVVVSGRISTGPPPLFITVGGSGGNVSPAPTHPTITICNIQTAVTEYTLIYVTYRLL
jgi:hypothetical protein